MKVAVHQCFWTDGTPVKRYQEAFRRESAYPVGSLVLRLEYYEPWRRWTKVARLLDGGKDLIPPLVKAEVFDIDGETMKVEGTYHDDVVDKFHSQSWRCKVLGP